MDERLQGAITFQVSVRIEINGQQMVVVHKASTRIDTVDGHVSK